MPGKRLEYAVRARRDLEAIEKYYLDVAGDVVADRVIDAILSQAEKIAALDLTFRPGIRYCGLSPIIPAVSPTAA